MEIIPTEEVNVLNKVEEIKRELRECNLKKTGYNKYHKYKYFELEDIIPTISALLDSYDLGSFYIFDDDKGALVIYDKLNGANHVWTTSIKEHENDMKDIQSIQTYARRALWLQALDIMETNNIELSKNVAKKKKTATAEEILNKIIKELQQQQQQPNTTNVIQKVKQYIDTGKIDDTKAEQVLKEFNKYKGDN